MSGGLTRVHTEGLLRLNRNWVWLDCCLDTILYYHWHLGYKGIKLDIPVWKSHVTIVRDSDDVDCLQLKERFDEPIPFWYDPEGIYTNGSYWWIDVHSEAIEDLRTELGLEPQPEYDLHLTIGKEYERRWGCTYGEHCRRD